MGLLCKLVEEMFFLEDCIYFKGLCFNTADEHLFIAIIVTRSSYKFSTYINAYLVWKNPEQTECDFCDLEVSCW